MSSSRIAVVRRGVFFATIVCLCTDFLSGQAWSAQTSDAPRMVSVAGVSHPAEGEIAIEGAIQTVAKDGGSLTLAVSTVTTPDGRQQQLNSPRPKTIVIAEGSPVFLASGESASEAAASDLRLGTRIRCVGANSGEGKPMVARVLLILTTAEAAKTSSLAGTVKVGENLLPHVEDKDAYTLFRNSDKAQGNVSVEGDALKISVTAVDAQEWSLMLGESKKLTLIEGVSYRLSFRAKADKAREYHVIALIDQPDYHNTGLFQPFTPTTDWQTFTYTFALHDTIAGHDTCPQFLLGREPGDLYLRDVTLAATADPIIPGNLLQPTANPNGFQMHTYGGAEATMTLENGALRVGVTKATGGAWNVQVTPDQTRLKEGVWYTLRFRAWSPVPRTLSVSSGTNTPPYHTVGLDSSVKIGQERKEYTLRFQAKGTITSDKGVNIAPIFPVGDAPGTLYLSNITLAPDESSAD